MQDERGKTIERVNSIQPLGPRRARASSLVRGVTLLTPIIPRSKLTRDANIFHPVYIGPTTIVIEQDCWTPAMTCRLRQSR